MVLNGIYVVLLHQGYSDIGAITVWNKENKK